MKHILKYTFSLCFLLSMFLGHSQVTKDTITLKDLDDKKPKVTAPKSATPEVKKDSVPENIADLLKNPTDKRRLFEIASNNVTSNEYIVTAGIKDLFDKIKNINAHWLALYDKFVIAYACLLMFFIGAPLGAIIRKGGLGTPLIFAIAFFMVFYFTSTSGEKFAKEGSWGMIPGMWFSFIILIPVGVFLTYKAMHDSQVFSKDFYNRLLKRLPVPKRLRS